MVPNFGTLMGFAQSRLEESPNSKAYRRSTSPWRPGPLSNDAVRARNHGLSRLILAIPKLRPAASPGPPRGSRLVLGSRRSRHFCATWAFVPLTHAAELSMAAVGTGMIWLISYCVAEAIDEAYRGAERRSGLPEKTLPNGRPDLSCTWSGVVEVTLTFSELHQTVRMGVQSYEPSLVACAVGRRPPRQAGCRSRWSPAGRRCWRLRPSACCGDRRDRSRRTPPAGRPACPPRDLQ